MTEARADGAFIVDGQTEKAYTRADIVEKAGTNDASELCEVIYIETLGKTENK